jgi:6-phosphofructokinase 1
MREVEKASGGTKLDPHGNLQLSGTGALGDFLAAALKIYWFHKYKKTIRVRADTLGYNQRAFPQIVSKVDLQEARMVGAAAVHEAMKGNVDGSIVIQRVSRTPDTYEIRIRRADLKKVSNPNKPAAGQIRVMPDSMINKKGNDVTQEFINYALPLVGELPRLGYLQQVLEIEP